MSAAPVVLYLDTWISPELLDHVVARCRERGSALLCLAPPPHPLAVSRLEPRLAALEAAGIAWSLRAVPAGVELPPAAELLVCAEGSALARHPGPLPAPLLILLNPASRALRGEPAAAPDWLAPRLHRGY